MNYIDTHFHLDLCKDYMELINEIENNKIYTIAVTNTPSVFDYTYNLTKHTKYIRTALGLHPELASQRINELSIFKDRIHFTKYIGEIGLDFRKEVSDENRKTQMEVFEDIITECSKFGNKILTIHSRGAHKEINEIINNNFPGKIILHWYSGSIKELERSLQNGYYFSINIAMLKSIKSHDIIKHIPIDKILTESDGPFIMYNNKTSSPLLMIQTVIDLALLLKLDPMEVGKRISDNFKFILESGKSDEI
jgi:TatD DNase family protein